MWRCVIHMIRMRGVRFKLLFIAIVGLIVPLLWTWSKPAGEKLKLRTGPSKLTKFESVNTIRFPEPGFAVRLTKDSEHSVSQQKCVHPRLDPFDPAVMEHYHKAPPISCSAMNDWVYVKDGMFHIFPAAVQLYGNITCEYVPILRDGDFGVKYGPTIKPMLDGASLTSDFFNASCESDKGETYSRIHAAVARNAAVVERLRNYHSPTSKKSPQVSQSPDVSASDSASLPPAAEDHSDSLSALNSLNLSVFMFGFDSLSHMAWVRSLPKTLTYYVNTLGGIEFDRYNIRGDGTPAALLPILTGKTEAELPEARRGHKGAKPVDNHPWIWKEFSKHGYVTAYAEDMQYVGTVQYRMLGFKNQPTDHFSRPYFLASEKTHTQHPPLCLGSTPRHVLFMNWFRDLFDMYKNYPKFFFGFPSELTHNTNDKAHLLDDDLVNLLRYLETKGHLNNTLLILMSDHGARYNHVRATAQGRLEERLPYFSFRFPPWFHRRYPDVVKNVQINAKRLTNPFDVYATFRHILNFSSESHGDVDNRGISLFKEIPKERTCANANIFPHWCACIQWDIVETSDPLVLLAVSSAIQKINNFTKPVRRQCAELQLLKITSSRRYIPTERELSSEQQEMIFESQQHSPYDELYQVVFKTTPGEGHFEVTCSYQTQSGTFVVDDNEISRVNKYGLQPACIAKKLPYIRQYCYCVSA